MINSSTLPDKGMPPGIELWIKEWKNESGHSRNIIQEI